MRKSDERRKERRLPVDGPVELLVSEPRTERVEGRLVDCSRGGFRACHNFAGLRGGQRVRFRHAHAEGTALVAWNRLADGIVESGFFIVEA